MKTIGERRGVSPPVRIHRRADAAPFAKMRRVTMSDGRRSPGIFRLLAVVLLIAPLAAVGWWLNRPAPTPDAITPPAELDVVCTGRVDVVGQVVALDPSQPGRVKTVKVTEGQLVRKFDLLLQLDDSAAVIREKQAKAVVDGLSAEVARAEMTRDRFPKQLEARRAMGDANAARADAAKKAIEQKKAQNGVGGTFTRIEMEAMDAQIRELDATTKSEAAYLADLAKENPDLLVTAAQARLDAAKADYALAGKAVQECKLLAPGPGRILRVQVGEGGIISAGGFTPAVVFAPDGPLVVRAEVDQEFLGRVKEGMTAEVQDDNRPDSTVRKGKIVSIAKWVARRRSMVLEPGEVNDVRTVECVVELDGGTDDLFIGQRMRVRIKR